MFTRRQLIAGAAVTPLVLPSAAALAQMATPAATPATAAAPTSDDVVPAWLDAQEALRQLGEAASEAFWNGDADALAQNATPDMMVALQLGFDLEDAVTSYTQNQIHFSFPEVGASFFGQFTPEVISGMFIQGGVLPWEVAPNEPQSGDVPTGTWTGMIGPGIIDLGIELEFTGDADALEATLSIPSQFLLNAPMQDVVFATDIPVGEMIDTRVLPAGGDVTFVNQYAEQYEWGSHTLVLDMYWTGDGQLAGLTMLPQLMLPEVTAPEPIRARLPFDGAWLTFWGGETEFRNYHAAFPSQRYAVDIAIWRDGATAVAPGTENENYHAFGQPYLAPVSGTVTSVVDGLEDITPQEPGNPGDPPVGNHVVIQVDQGYVFLAHCERGSIVVAEGDTVEAGDVVARIGNSGNTSEPHVHIHAQESADPNNYDSPGIPMIFENVLVNGELEAEAYVQHGTIVEQRS